MYRFTLALLEVLIVAGCAAKQQPSPTGYQQAAFFSSGAHGSSSGPDSSEDGSPGGGKALAVPHRNRATGVAEIQVRPDVLTAEFAVREVKASSQLAMTAVRATFDELAAQLAHSIGGGASLKLRGLALGKVLQRDKFIGISATIDGLLEVPLPKDLDFWARGRVLTSVLEATGRLSEISLSKDDPLRAVKFEEAQPALRDPETYRAQLLERWIARARAFAQLAQSKEAPLSLLDCSAPAAITQTQVSLDEITLQLPMSCRVDSIGGDRSAPGGPGAPARPDSGR